MYVISHSDLPLENICMVVVSKESLFRGYQTTDDSPVMKKVDKSDKKQNPSDPM